MNELFDEAADSTTKS